MLDRFTDRARKVMSMAKQEALDLHSNKVGTEHLLLALAKEDEGIAAEALRSLEAALGKVANHLYEGEGRTRDSLQAMEQRIDQIFASGGAVNVKIAGGSLSQPNSDDLTVDGLAKLTMGAGQDSCGRGAPAQTIGTSLVAPDGTDATVTVVDGP